MKKWILLFAVLLATSSQAQPYSINWHKVAAGGGASSNGQYSLNGTIGQQDAGTAMTGGSYSVTGGFWSFIALVQYPGAPVLSISQAGNSVIISWPSPSTGYYLQSNNDLTKANWTIFTGTIVTNSAGTSNSVTLTPPVGNSFFRLGP